MPTPPPTASPGEPGRRVRAAIVVGTRPEAIKMAPVCLECLENPRLEPHLILTGQHRDLVDPILSFFGIVADHRLASMGDGGISGLLARAVTGLDALFERLRPDVVLVHGDTTSTLAGGLAAFHRRIPVAHVEAGLRTHDLARPFPEEMNRQTVDRFSSLHFAPTPAAVEALRAEGFGEATVRMVGNTAIDALLLGIERLDRAGVPARPRDGRRSILVTLHRREGLHGGLERAARAIARIAERPDVEITLPVHPNPEVRAIIRGHLAGRANVRLTEPLDYPEFLAEMRRAHVILTDSGGIQEEAPSLDVPVLILRERTERPEAVEAGAARLVGFDEERIYHECCLLLDDARAHAQMAGAVNPFGDGTAARRIVACIGEEDGFA